jgi:hypothetical protein
MSARLLMSADERTVRGRGPEAEDADRTLVEPALAAFSAARQGERNGKVDHR